MKISLCDIASGYFVSDFLFALNYFSVEQVPVLRYRPFVIIVDDNFNRTSTANFICWVVEFCDVRVIKRFFCGKSLVWIEAKQLFEQVQCVFRSLWEYILQIFRLRLLDRIEHSRGKWRINCLNVLLRRPARDL